MMDFADLKSIFSQFPELKLVYLFGSRARQDNGPMSDFDFALFVDEKDPLKRFDIKTTLLAELGKLLATEKIDIVILNELDGPELKFNVIFEGKLIYEVEPFKVLIEPKIMNEYFDFHESLKRFGLTKA